MPKSTLHGLISTLREGGLIDQSPTDGKYHLGVRLFELGSAVSRSWDIISVSKKYMQKLAAQTGESVNLSVVDKGEVLILEHADTGKSLVVNAGAGNRFPVHCTAAGKVLLAYMKFSDAYLILKRKGMFEYTPHTITHPGKMKEELETIFQKGIAVENGEHRIGLRSVAAPIFDSTGRAVYSISITGMYRRITEDTFIAAQKYVKETAARMSFDLGYRGK